MPIYFTYVETKQKGALLKHDTIQPFTMAVILWAAVMAVIIAGMFQGALPVQRSQYSHLCHGFEAGPILDFAPPIVLPEEEPALEMRLKDISLHAEDTYHSELLLLAKVINAEMGGSWIPDWVQLAVGSVVLNRVCSDQFPDTIYDVVYQTEPRQYGSAWNGSFERPITEQVWANAVYLMEHGSTIPSDVLYQSTNPRNGKALYISYYDSVLGTTTYFNYG